MGGSSSKEVPIQDSKRSAIPPPSPAPVHDENAPLPREKLPKALQKIVDNDDDSVFDQLYEGRYVRPSNTIRFLPTPIRSSMRLDEVVDVSPAPLSPPTPMSVTLPTPPEHAPSSSLPNATWRIHQT